jgi:hypothetical protein
MMIDIINKYLKNLDYKYINFIKESKSLFNEAFLVFVIYRIIKVYLPYFLYKIIRKIEVYLYKNIYIYLLRKYRNVTYTIFLYPKHYKNFKFIQFINKNIHNDYNNIIHYYLNIFNIDK